MTTLLILLIVVVGVALIFDFFNGFHDAANAISTLVISKTLTPFMAVLLAGFANFAGYIFWGMSTEVAGTVAKGIVDFHLVDGQAAKLLVLVAALFGAILWNIITWLLGLPTSSSHALIGGLLGAGVAAVGFDAILWFPKGFDPAAGVWFPKEIGLLFIIAFIFVAPSLGMLGAAIITSLSAWIFNNFHPRRATTTLRFLQLFSASWNAIGHGRNDAQKTMGIIAMALMAFNGTTGDKFHIDQWVVLSCYIAMALGTMFGGWRIVKTMGTGITKIRPLEGFSADTSSAMTLTMTAAVGIPVSTTHVIAGSIMGVGAVQRAAGVRWVTARKILWAWLLTIPLTGLCAWAVYTGLKALFGVLGIL